MRRLPLTTSLLLALTAAASGCARPPVTGAQQTVRPRFLPPVAVRLRWLPPVGQVTHYRMTSELWVRRPGMTPADTAQPILEGTEYLTTTVIARKGGTWTETLVVDSAQTESSVGARVPRYLLRGMTVRTTFDSLGWKDSAEVTPLPGTPAAVKQGLQRTAGVGEPDVLLPQRPVRVGESWTHSTTFLMPWALNARHVIRTPITFRLERLERDGKDRVAVISSTEPIAADGAAANGGAASETGAIEGTYRFDLDAGRVLDQTIETNVQIKTSIGTSALRTHMETQRLK